MTSSGAPLGTWTLRYEAARGILERLVTPFADSLLWTTDARGRPGGTSAASAGPWQAVAAIQLAYYAAQVHSEAVRKQFEGGMDARGNTRNISRGLCWAPNTGEPLR